MYSNFLQMVDAGVVQTARIDDGMSHIYFRLQWPKQPAGEAAAAPAASEGVPLAARSVGRRQHAIATASTPPSLPPEWLMNALSAAGSKAQALQSEPQAAAAAAAAAADTAARQAPSTTFFTKRVADPNLVPLLLSKGVQFGAVRVRLGPVLPRRVGASVSAACGHLLQAIRQSGSACACRPR